MMVNVMPSNNGCEASIMVVSSMWPVSTTGVCSCGPVCEKCEAWSCGRVVSKVHAAARPGICRARLPRRVVHVTIFIPR